MAEFIPALRFGFLTPAFDYVVAVTVRGGAVRKRVLARAALRDGEEMLDVGCGTGTLAVAAARSAGAQVTGVDADPAILARARRKAASAGVQVRFDEADATRLPYGDATFDVVVSTLFFHHLPDEAKAGAAREFARVLRPGGRVVVGDYGRGRDPVMRAAFAGTVRLFDGLPNTAAHARGELPQVLAAGGLRDVATGERLRTPTGTVDIITAHR